MTALCQESKIIVPLLGFPFLIDPKLPIGDFNPF